MRWIRILPTDWKRVLRPYFCWNSRPCSFTVKDKVWATSKVGSPPGSANRKVRVHFNFAALADTRNVNRAQILGHFPVWLIHLQRAGFHVAAHSLEFQPCTIRKSAVCNYTRTVTLAECPRRLVPVAGKVAGGIFLIRGRIQAPPRPSSLSSSRST